MEEYISKEAYELSMGQKQRVTIAGVLSIKPKYIIMDEPTAMLDPEGKEDVKKIVRSLKEQGYTIIYITRVIFIGDGQISRRFETKEILENMDYLREKGIIIPKTIELVEKLKEKGIEIGIEDLF